jgi:hypothetical protein
MSTSESTGEVASPDHFLHSALQAAEVGRFPLWFADVWLSNGIAAAYCVDRPWLENLGGRLEEVLRGDPRTWEDGLQGLMNWLSHAAWSGPHNEAAEFFLVHVVADMHSRAVQERSGRVPETNQSRAFASAIALIRFMRDEARKRGISLDVGATDLNFVAQLVAKDILRGENISVTDVLRAIREHTVEIPLAEWVEEAPTKH